MERSHRPEGLSRLGVLLVVGALALSSCGESSDDSKSGSDSGKLKFGLVTQLSIADYFATEAQGAKEKADELGIDLQVVDAGQDTAKQLSMSKSLITSGVDALAIVPSNTDIGPRATALAAGADIPLVASDSPLEDSDGKAVPFVGLDNEGSGTQVGEILAREFETRGWSLDDTYYALVEAPEIQVCNLRTNASLKVFQDANPDFDESHVVKTPYDGTPGKATASMRAVITAHPEAKHWVISSCNDDGVVGALRALEAKGATATDQLGVGLGGNLACQVFTTPYLADGMPISTYLDPKSIGAAVVQTMKDMVDGKDVPAEVFVDTPELTKDNYADLVDCKA